MPERVTERDVPDLIDEINQKLKQFKIDYSGMTLRDKVKRLVDVDFGYAMRALANPVPPAHRPTPTRRGRTRRNGCSFGFGTTYIRRRERNSDNSTTKSVGGTTRTGTRTNVESASTR